MIETFRYLAGVIAAHPNRQVVGRTRLQKTVRLLQRLGFPTGYSYRLFFYGPYSDGVHGEVRLLEHLGLVKDELKKGQDNDYYVITASEEAVLPEIKPFQKKIDMMSSADATVLELAATYDAYRDLGYDHEESLRRVHRKKGAKCNDGRLDEALRLLQRLGLPAD